MKRNVRRLQRFVRWNPGYILTLSYTRSFNAHIRPTVTLHHGRLCHTGLYDTRMDCFTRTVPVYTCPTTRLCDAEYCTSYTTHRHRDILALRNYWLRLPVLIGGLV